MAPELSLKSVVRPTTVIRSPLLDEALGCHVVLASETFQHTGSFKFRAAFNVASKVPQARLIAASSGNFGQALSYACKLLGKSCTIVMPVDSAKVKVDAVRSFGGRVDLVDIKKKTRAERVAELAKADPEAVVVSAYDHRLVIEGNASLGDEIVLLPENFHYIVVPIGGGGLISGVLTAVLGSECQARVIGAEPLLANDAARSLKQGQVVKNESEPPTIADGARTVSLGQENWQVISKGLSDIVEVPEEKIKDAVKLLFLKANLKVEPTGALPVAALLTSPDLFAGKNVCCVVSGGNVDPSVYAKILLD